MKHIILTCIFSLQILQIPSAFAHHSTSEYDISTVLEIEGELVNVHWKNPHVNFTVRVPNSNNEFEDWHIETAAIYVLNRSGLDASMFPLGSNIRVAGAPSRNRNAIEPTNVLLPNGDEIQFFNAKGFRWNQNAVGGELLNQEVDRPELGLFRVWSLDTHSMGKYQNATEIIANAKYINTNDQDNNNASYDSDPCVPQGMPGTMVNPLSIQFIDQGNHIDLLLTPFSIQRRIIISNDGSNAPTQPSIYGISQGSFSNQTLEVHTTQIDWPYFDDAGRPQSSNAAVFEKFTITDGGNKLLYTQTISDPETLVEPVTIGWSYIDIGEESIEPLFCEQ